MESILTSSKRLIGGIPEEEDHFDPEIITYINSVFATLRQMGVGPAEGFRIEGEDATWDEFTEGNTRLEFVRDYMASKVKLKFDPPDRTVIMEALKSNIAELEFRLHVAADESESY